MSILKISKIGHPILLNECSEIKEFSSDSLKKIGGKYFSARGKKIDNILQMIEKDALKKRHLQDVSLKR